MTICAVDIAHTPRAVRINWAAGHFITKPPRLIKVLNYPNNTATYTKSPESESGTILRYDKKNAPESRDLPEQVKHLG
jgi:hypothetical protein